MKKIVILSSRTGQALKMLSYHYPIHAAVCAKEKPSCSLLLPTPQTEEDWKLLAQECDDCLVISLGFMKVIPPVFFESVYTLNVHPGKLPEFKGKDPHLQALRAGVEYTAVTIHEVVKELDSGKVLVEIPVRITDEEREVPSLLDSRLRRIAVLALRALLEGIAPL